MIRLYALGACGTLEQAIHPNIMYVCCVQRVRLLNHDVNILLTKFDFVFVNIHH